MGYLTGYLSLGVLALIAIGADHLVRCRGRAYKRGKLAEQLRRRRQSLLSIVIERVAAPIAVAIGIIVAWPLAAVFAIHFFRKRAEASDHVEASRVKAFCVEREHLIEPVTLEDIERRELVFDPLKAVPKKPFGHLNTAWQVFLERVLPTDQLWSFEAPWREYGGATVQRMGYASVRDNQVSAFFIKKAKPFPSNPRQQI